MTSHLVGLTEIAAILGVSRQRVDQLAKLEGFPTPVVEIAAGRVWSRDDIDEWARTTGRL